MPDKSECEKQILEMTARNKGCKIEDLESRTDKFGNVHVRRRDASKKR